MPNRPWSRSFVDIESIDQMPLDAALQILLFGVLGHATELKMELDKRDYAEDVIQSFLNPLESACQDLKSFLTSESASFVPEGIPVYIQVAIASLSQLTTGEFEEKAKDLIVKLEKLLKLVEQIEN